jgi:hypothetical protein
MIDLEKIYDLITRAFQESQETFHWGDNAIIRGSLETLPKPERLDEFGDGDYFALVDINTIVPERAGNIELIAPVYHYAIILCRKGRVDDITRQRQQILNRFMEGWHNFWMKRPNWTEDTFNIYPQINELESIAEILACQIVGTISQITRKGGRLDE